MLALWAAIALGEPLARVEPTALRTVVADVRVVDRHGALTGPYDVLLAHGTIEALAPVGEGARFPAEVTVDGTGRTLLPGLVDVHVHLGSALAVRHHLPVPRVQDNLDALLYAGVTTVCDLGLPRPALDRVRKRIARGRAGPAVYGTGRPFDAPDGHGKVLIRAMYPGPLVRAATAHLAWEVTTAHDVDAALAKQGAADGIKVMLDSLPEGSAPIAQEALERLRLGATALGVPLIAHVGRVADLERAVDLPVDRLAHAPYFGTVTPELAARVAAADLAVSPTLAVWEAHAKITEGAPFLGPLEREILPRRQEAWLDAVPPRDLPDVLLPWSDALVAHRADRASTVRALASAGVTLLVGSDAPGSGLVAGAGTHRELDLLADAGLSPARVLRAATWDGARALDPDGRFGAVEAGWEADLLLVDGDPTTDLGAVHRVVAVWVDGRRVARSPVD